MLEQVMALGREALVQLIKLTQKHGLKGCNGGWHDYLQASGVQGGGKDPARHEVQTLQTYILSLLQPPPDLPASVDFNTRTVRRFIKFAARQTKEEQLGATSAPPPSPQQPGDKVTIWQLVQDTRSHERYSTLYSFPSMMPGWARTKRRVVRDAATAQPPRLLAIDCEMVKTVEEDKALVNLSVVDETGAVVYKTMVKPRSAVVDYKTDLTGITAEQLQDVTTTRSEARRAVKTLLVESWRRQKQLTVLVGHGLSNDLLALRLDHQPIIDTALLFTYRGLLDCTPGLRDLHRALLGSDMAKRGEGLHDSTEDAWASMQLVLHELQQTSRTAPLPPPATKADREELRKLLVHSIPSSLAEEQLLALFQPLLLKEAGQLTVEGGHATGEEKADKSAPTADDSDDSDSDSEDDVPLPPELSNEAADSNCKAATPCLTQMPSFDSQPGIQHQRAVLVFRHAGEANAAFKALEGKAQKDSMGRPMKAVKLEGGQVVKVRKSAGHNGFVFQQSGKEVVRVTPKQQQHRRGPPRGAANGKQPAASSKRKLPVSGPQVKRTRVKA